MSDLNLGVLTATDANASAASATATASAIATKQILIMGFDGSSYDQPFTVELKIGGSTVLTMQGAADSTVGRDLTSLGGIPAGDNTAVTVVTTPSASGSCNANLLYKIIF